MTALEHTTPDGQRLDDDRRGHLKQRAMEMVVLGRSVTSVSKELGIRATTLISWLRCAGVTLQGRPRPNVKVSHTERASAVQQVVAGRHATQVAVSLGVTAAAVYQWVRAAGLSAPRHISKSNASRYSEEFKVAAVRQVRELGHSVETASVAVGVSHQTLRNWLRALDAAVSSSASSGT